MLWYTGHCCHSNPERLHARRFLLECDDPSFQADHGRRWRPWRLREASCYRNARPVCMKEAGSVSLRLGNGAWLAIPFIGCAVQTPALNP